MNLKLNILFLILLFGNGHSFSLEESQQSFNDFAKALSIFSRENSADFLKRFSFENISQQCSDHTQIFQERITGNPTIGLANEYWELKSIFIKYYIESK
jgi:hypothetical protein